MKKIWNQCVKELNQFRRDRLTVALAFVLPLATLLIFGFAIRLESQNIPLAVRDFDNSPLSRAYIERLYATNKFKPVALSGKNPSSVLDRGEAKATVIIPPEFERRLQAGNPIQIQALIDGSDVANARVIQNSIKFTTRYFLVSAGLQSFPNWVDTEVRLWFNPGNQESLFIVPGVYAITLTLYPSLLMAIAMVRDKEESTIVQIYASNISAIEFLLGKSLAYTLIAIAEAIFLMGIGSLIWQLGFAGNPLPLLLGTPIFLLDSVFFGLLIGVITTAQSSAVQAVGTIKALASMLLTGFMYPLSNIPFPLDWLSFIVPARYYIDLTRDAFVRGTGWAGVWYVFPALIILGVIDLAIAWWGIRRMQLPD
ncbi:ABC transporter permease [Pleurocapsales cyanobacterium LEGE 10410]|nr:ABC transporter permease [Pleurocapsales cyanobacterium LEGE 10410]